MSHIFNALKNLRASSDKYGFARLATQDEVTNGVTLSSDIAFVSPETLQSRLSTFTVDTSNVITLDTDQEVTGIKTFKDRINFIADNSTESDGTNEQLFVFGATQLTKGTKPDQQAWTSIVFTDKTYSTNTTNTNRYAGFGATVQPSGDTSIKFYACDWSVTTNKSATLQVYYPYGGKPYATAPTPLNADGTIAINDNSTKIATTAFVKAHGSSNYVTLNADQSISGTKTFNTLNSSELRSGNDSSEISIYASKSAVYGSCVKFYGVNESRTDPAGTSRKGAIEIFAGTTSSYANCFLTSEHNWFEKPLMPYYDNSIALGNTNYRWKQLCAGTTTISTSDERLKNNISLIPDKVLDVWGEIDWHQFKFNDAIAEKGEANARLHTGLIAQEIKLKFENNDLDATEYGLLCHDNWEEKDWDEKIIDKKAVTEIVEVIDKEAEYDTNGNEISPKISHNEEKIIEPEVSHTKHHHIDAGDIYSLRYEECLCIEAAYQRRRADRLENELNNLKQEMNEIKALIKEINS